MRTLDSTPKHPDYPAMIKEAIRTTQPAKWRNFGTVYRIGDGLVAKVFRHHGISKETARSEFVNLVRLYGLDEDLRVPEPMGFVGVGTVEELIELGFPHMSGEMDETIYATVLEEIIGQPMKYLEKKERWHYKDSVLRLREALIRHKIYKDDLKALDIMAEEGSDEVVMIDVHNVQFDQDPSRILYSLMWVLLGKSLEELTKKGILERLRAWIS